MKPSCTCKQSRIRYPFTTSCLQVSQPLLKSWASAHVMVTWEDKHHNHKYSPFLLLSQKFYCRVCHMYRISLWSFWVSCLSCVLSQFLGHLWTSHKVGRVGKRKPGCWASTAQQQPKYWYIANTVLVINPEHSTIEAAMI